MRSKTCDNCGRIIENKGFSITELIDWPPNVAGRSLGEKDFCSLGCFVDWAAKNLRGLGITKDNSLPSDS